MLQNILVTLVLFSGNFLQGECTVDLFKIPDPNKPCHLEIVKSVNNDTDHSGSRVIDTDVKSQLISTHLLFSITKAVLFKKSHLAPGNLAKLVFWSVLS